MDGAKFSKTMAEVQAGNVAAMDSLLLASYDPLRSVIAQQMSDTLRKAQLEPEDVIQETYAAAWASLPKSQFESFDGRRPPGASRAARTSTFWIR